MSTDTTTATPNEKSEPRQKYQAPVIEEIEIVAGEAMLGFCKSAGQAGAFAICGAGCSAAGS